MATKKSGWFEAALDTVVEMITYAIVSVFGMLMLDAAHAKDQRVPALGFSTCVLLSLAAITVVRAGIALSTKEK